MADEDTKRRQVIAKKIRLGLWALLCLTVMVFLISNHEEMELCFFFDLLTMKGPKAFFIFLFLIAGFAGGFGACLIWMRHTRNKKESCAKEEEDEVPVSDGTSPDEEA
jgi:uncharacterized integral membrane protein